MRHLKGSRFGFDAVKRIGVLDDRESHRVKWNSHAGCEIHYILKGGYSWEISGSTDPLELTGGTFAVVPPRRRHRAGGSAGPSQRIGVILEPSGIRTDGPQPAGYPIVSSEEFSRIVKRFRERALQPRPITANLAAILRETRDAVNEFSPDDPDSSLRLRLAVAALLHETYRALESPDTALRGDNAISDLKRWIAAHLSEKITNHDLVRASGYSRSRFFSLFYADTGMTPKDYLIRERLRLAKRLLSSSAASTLSDIASRSGFSSARAFTAAYRRHYGAIPKSPR